MARKNDPIVAGDLLALREMLTRAHARFMDWPLIPDKDYPGVVHTLSLGCPDGGPFTQFLFDKDGKVVNVKVFAEGSRECECKYCRYEETCDCPFASCSHDLEKKGKS